MMQRHSPRVSRCQQQLISTTPANTSSPRVIVMMTRHPVPLFHPNGWKLYWTAVASVIVNHCSPRMSHRILGAYSTLLSIGHVQVYATMLVNNMPIGRAAMGHGYVQTTPGATFVEKHEHHHDEGEMLQIWITFVHHDRGNAGRVGAGRVRRPLLCRWGGSGFRAKAGERHCILPSRIVRFLVVAPGFIQLFEVARAFGAGIEMARASNVVPGGGCGYVLRGNVCLTQATRNASSPFRIAASDADEFQAVRTLIGAGRSDAVVHMNAAAWVPQCTRVRLATLASHASAVRRDHGQPQRNVKTMWCPCSWQLTEVRVPL